MVNVLSLATARCRHLRAVRDFESGGYVILSTKRGTVKKTELSAFSHPRSGGILAISLDAGDEVWRPAHRRPARVLLSTSRA